MGEQNNLQMNLTEDYIMKKHLKLYTAFLTSAFLMCSAIPLNTAEHFCPMLTAEAEDETATSGKCGDSVSWTLDENGVLTISGKAICTIIRKHRRRLLHCRR